MEIWAKNGTGFLNENRRVTPHFHIIIYIFILR